MRSLAENWEVQVGTDFVELFDRRMHEQIAALDDLELVNFASAKWDQLRHSTIRYGYVEGTSVLDHVRERLVSHSTPALLREDLVRDLCFGSKMLHLDYWACYAEVFGMHPPGSISSLQIFPEDEPEEVFLILLPEHVDQMLAGLASHSDDLKVMTHADIAELKAWNDLCRADPEKMIAYFFDF